jgi:hypothetical protein
MSLNKNKIAHPEMKMRNKFRKENQKKHSRRKLSVLQFKFLTEK